MGIETLRFRLERVLRIMRQFMPHSNQHIANLTTAPAENFPAFDYDIVRSARRRTIVVQVQRGTVRVRAPHFVGDAEIRGFVDRHRKWIAEKLVQQAHRAAEQSRLAEGGSIFYKGRTLRVHWRSASHSGITVEGREFIIHGRNLSEERAGRILQQWLIRQARDVLPARSRALAAHLQVESRFKDVVFRKTRSKWGHCTTAGRIQFNWLIMLAPDAIIDYMICHEVCHLLHMNHSRQFWEAVESVCPDYRTYVKWLKDHEHRLWV